MIKVKESKKKILKWIKTETDKLQPQFYTAYSKYFQPKVIEEDGQKFLQFAEPETFPVNHKRRAWRAYKRDGLVGITNYFQKYGYELTTHES